MAEALDLLDCSVAWVVSGSTGNGKWMDEISPSGLSKVFELREGSIQEIDFRPSEVGMDLVPVDALVGGNPEKNLEIAESVLRGDPSPTLEAVASNAGVSLFLVGRAESPSEGVEQARSFLAGGEAGPYAKSLAANAPVAVG
jgi:anthranilate phosphoribosyltransferase